MIEQKLKITTDTSDVKKKLKQLDGQDVEIDVKADTSEAESTLNKFKSSVLDGLAIGSGFAIAERALGGLVDAGKAAFDSFKNFDSAVQNIATLDVVDDVQGLRDVLNEVSTTTVDDASVLADATYQALSAGVRGSNEELGKFAQTASKVATAGGSDAETAVDALTTVMNSFKIETKDAGLVSDQIFATIKAGKTSFGELSSSLSNVTGAASSAGLQFGEVAAGIATLTAQGVPTAQATTKIRSAIIALQKPNKDTADLFKQMGLSAQDVATRLKAPIEEGGGLTNLLNDLGKEAEKNGKSFTQLFSSVEASGAALALTGNNAGLAFENLNSVINESAGSADFAYEEASASIENRIGLVLGSVQALFNNLFIALEPLISGILNAFAFGIDGINFVVGNFGTIMTGIVDTIETFAPLLIGIGTALVIQNKQWLITNANLIKNQAITTAKLIKDKAVILVTQGWTVAQRALNLVMNANPIGLIVTAVGLLTTGIIYLVKNTEFGADAWESFSSVMIDLWNWIQETAIVVWDELLGYLRIGSDLFMKYGAYLTPFTAAFKLAYDNIEPFRDVVDQAWEALKELGDTFLGVGKEILDFLGFTGKSTEELDKNSDELNKNNKELDKNKNKNKEVADEIDKTIPKIEDETEAKKENTKATKKQVDGLTALKNKISETKKAFEIAVFEGQTKKAKLLKAELDNLEKSLNNYKTKLNNLSLAFGILDINSSNVVSNFKELGFDANSFSAQIDNATGKLITFDKEFKELERPEFELFPEKDVFETFNNNIDETINKYSSLQEAQEDLKDLTLLDILKPDDLLNVSESIDDISDALSKVDFSKLLDFDGKKFIESFKKIGLTSKNTGEIIDSVFTATNELGNQAIDALEGNTEAQKIAAIAQATINIALGITKAIASKGLAGILEGAAISAFGAVQLSAIRGANDGVIAIDDNYNKKPSGNDSKLIMVDPMESIISRKGTLKGNNRVWLELANKGLDIEQEFLKSNKFLESTKNSLNIPNSYDFGKIENRLYAIENKIGLISRTSDIKIDLIDRPQKNSRSMFTRRVNG